MYNVQCAINNVQSSSAMTSDERWLHDWSPMPSTEFHPYLCWNTQMSPTIRTYFQNGSKFSSHLKKAQYLQVSFTLLKHSNVSNISTRIRSPKWKQNLKSFLKGPLSFTLISNSAVETLNCYTPFTNIFILMRSPKWKSSQRGPKPLPSTPLSFLPVETQCTQMSPNIHQFHCHVVLTIAKSFLSCWNSHQPL